MAKQLNVNLAMTADTSKARAELQSLSKTLDSLMLKTAGKENFGLSTELQKSVSLAAQLKTQLASATMSNGNLDLSKFNLELQKSGLKISDYKTALTSMGPAGTQAFSQLASSIMSAEVPLRRSNTLLLNFATTLKNTARWQISSSILHGFMGAIQSAYGYAQDLNESLNNIRIVTGQSVEQMSQFADQANKAAQALSTTTTAYTDAALIYYQQGIRDQNEIADRTETTIKLANVSRQSAEEVSSQMTAIWNNFDNGSKALEYYADVITALGATTAASSEEIAGGMEKFAAVAETVGLSYEYAASALATIVATTRQSEDTVGTGLRTIFSRLEGLKLGETLEDGVDLNKYSKALETIGVNIMDATGNLKEMDTILDETAAHWDNLDRSQKVAFATTVGGVRQYTNLIALMDNWDMMQENVFTAKGSEGTLQEQADIYAESWEAAQKRVKAAAQSIYADLLDDKFFIGLLNGFEKALSGIDNFIDGIGGVKSVLLLLGSIVTQVFGQQITAALRNTIDNFRMMSAAGREATLQLRQDAIQEGLSTVTTGSTVHSGENAGATAAINAQAQAQQALLTNESRLTEEEKLRAQTMIKVTEQLGEQAVQAGKVADETQRASSAAIRQAQRKVLGAGGADQWQEVKKAQEELRKSYSDSEKTLSAFQKNFNNLDLETATFEEVNQAVKKFSTEIHNLETLPPDLIPDISGEIFEIMQTGGDIGQVFDQLENKLVSLPVEHLDALKTALNETGLSSTEVENVVTSLANKFEAEAQAAADAAESNEKVANSGKAAVDGISAMAGKTGDAVAGFTAFTSVIMSLSAAINAFKNIGDILSNDDLSTGEKMVQMFSALAMVIPLVTAVTREGALADMSAFAKKVLHIGATTAETAAEGASIPVKAASAAATWAMVWPVLALTAALGAIIALVVLFTKAWQDYQKTTPEGKLKTTQETAIKLKDALDEAQQKANNLRSAFDDYSSIRDKLNSCVEGTQEWRDTLEEVNNKVLEIMQEYPDLVGYMDISSENGQLMINNIDEVLARVDLATQHLQAATISTNAQAKVAQFGIDKRSILDTYGDYVEPDGVGYVDEATYAQVMAQRSLVNDLIENASEYLGTSLEDFTTQFGEDLHLTDTELLDFYYAIQAIGRESNNVANELDAAAKAVATSAISEEFGYLDGNIQTALATVASKNYQATYDEIYNKVIETSHGYFADQKTADLNTIGSLWDRYLNAIGEDRAATKYRLDNNAIRGNDQNRTYHFNNGTEEISLTEEEMARVIAASEAMGQLGDSAKELAKAFTTMDQEAQDFAATLINSKDANNNFHPEDFLASLNFGQLQAIANGINGNHYNAEAKAAMGGISAEDFNALAQAMDMAGSELLELLQTSATALEENFLQIGDTLTNTPKEIFDNTIQTLTNLSYNEAKQLADTYQEIFNSGGKEALITFDNMIQSVGEEYRSDFAAILASADWSDWDVDKTIIAALNDLDIPIPENFEEWINSMRTATNATKDLNIDSFRSNMAEVTKILDSTKEWGSTLSADDFVKLGEGYDDYFTLMADGTYKLTGDAKAFYDAVMQKQRGELLGNIAAAGENIKKAEELRTGANLGGYSLSELGTSAKHQNEEGKNVYNKDHLSAQIDFIETMGAANTDVIGDWRQDIEDNGTVEAATFDAVNAAMEQAIALYGELDSSIEENQKIQQESIEALLSTATSLEDLNSIQELMIENGIDVTQYEQEFANETHILGMEAAQSATSMEELQRIQSEYGLSAQDVSQKTLEFVNNIMDLNELLKEGYVDLETYDQAVNDLAMNASSLEELQQIRASGMIGEDGEAHGLDTYEYGQALLNLAEQFDNTADEAEKYNQALFSGDTAQIEATQSALELAIQTGELAEKYGLDAETTENYAHRLAEAFEEVGMSEEAAAKLGLQAAVANQRLDRGLTKLNKNLDDYKKKLNSTNKGSAEWSETMDELKDNLADILNVDVSTLTDDFAEATLESEDLQKALKGDVEAIKRLQAAAAEEMIATIRTNLEGEDLDVFNSQWEYLKANMAQAIESPGIDQTNLINSFNAMIAAGNMTKEQIEAALAGLHVSANIHTNYVPQKITVPTTITDEYVSVIGGYQHYYPNFDGTVGSIYIPSYRKWTSTYDGPPHEVTGWVPQYTIEGTEGPGGITTGFAAAPTPKASGGATSSGGKGGGGGGGGSSRKAAEPKENKERYHVITKEIDSLTKVYDRLSKAKDRAFGANRLKLMEQEAANIQDQIDKQEELIGQVEAYMKIDRGNLQHGSGTVKGLDYYGLTAQYDIDGNITNWDAIQAAALAEVNKQIGRYNSGLIDEDAKEAAEKQYEGFLELVNQYEETNEKFQNEMDKRQDLLNQLQDLNYEKLDYELEVKIKLREADLRKVEYQIKKLGDNIYTAAEALSNLFSTEGASKATLAAQGLEEYSQHFDNLQAAYEKGEISQADYIEGIEKARDGLYDELEALIDINDEMKDYYSNTLSNASDELAKFTEQIEHNIAIVENLQEILTLAGKETDYTAMGKVLRANAAQSKAMYEEAKAEFDMYYQQRLQAEEAYQRALEEGGAHAIEIAKANMEAAIEYANEAEERMQSDLITFLENNRAVIENELNKTKQSIDNMYTGGKGWDYINQTMELAERAADRYLTKTNQIYETNKLLRDVQKDIDNTTNKASKQKLANFTKEIESLQKTTKLSKNQLEIAKAQYEVLKAQIALEEEQNAKSTVRLQRDSEGNYGYVYTADQDKVNDALADLEAKQNDLYNLVREQENEAAKEIMDTNQERTEALYDLWYQYYVDKSISEEEYLARSLEVNQRYNSLLEGITRDHITALSLLSQTSATGGNDTYTNEFEGLIANGYSVIGRNDDFWQVYNAQTGEKLNLTSEQFQEFYELLMSGATNAADFITENVADMSDAVAADMREGTDAANEAIGSMDDTIDRTTSSTITLAGQLVGEDGLIAKLGDQASKVQENTDAWGEYYDILEEFVIPGVETLIDRINEVIEIASKQIDVNVVTHYSLDGIGAGGYTGSNYSGGYSGGSGSGSSSGSGSRSSGSGNKSSGSGSTSTARSYGGGCFVPGTKVIMGDYSEKNIEDVQINDFVIAYDEEKDWFEAKRVTKSYVHHNTPRIINIYLSNGIKLGITPGHPIMTTQGWKSRDIENSLYEHGVIASWLNIGDTVLSFGNNAMVLAIKELEISDNFDSYNIEVEDLHTYIADGVVVHNIKVNTLMARRSGGYSGNWPIVSGQSGFYTGEWDGPDIDPNGKLAFLHQKELVLNAGDTENMLSAIKIIRQISNNIDLRAASQASAAGITSPSYMGANQILEQEVNIHAEFPNATNHLEIEEAFNNLVNRASQYAGRSSSIKE